MIKSLLLLSLLSLISCDDIDATTKKNPDIRYACFSGCPNKTDWSIRVGLPNFPENLLLKIDNQIALDECFGSGGYSFRVSRNNINEIYADDVYKPQKKYVSIQIIDKGENCNLNENFYHNSHQYYSINSKLLKIKI